MLPIKFPKNVTSEQCYNLTQLFFSKFNASLSVAKFNPWNCTEVYNFVVAVQDYSIVKGYGEMKISTIISIIFIIICSIMLTFQLTTLPIFLIHKNYRKNVCFRILFANGLADSIQLGTYLIYSILNLTMFDLNKELADFGGAVIIPIWSLVVIQHFLLALNRLIMIMRAKYLGSKYIPDVEVEQRIFNLALLFSWFLYIAVFALFYSPFVGTVLDRETMVFKFDLEQPYTQTFQYVNWACTIWMPWCCFFIYAIIVWTARKSRRIQQSENVTKSENNNGTNKSNIRTSVPLLNDYERRLLIQAIILYTVMAFLIIGWYLIDRCEENFETNKRICKARIFGIVLFEIPLKWHSILIEIPWMAYCGFSPILFLAMNREFRSRFIHLYTRKSPEELSQLLTEVTILNCSNPNRRYRQNNKENGNVKEKVQRKAISFETEGNGNGTSAPMEIQKRKMTA